MSRYSRGADRERKVAEDLRIQGYYVMRSAASHGAVDLIALRTGEKPRLIQVKTDAQFPFHHFGPAARAELLKAAKQAGGVAELIWWPMRGQPQTIAQEKWPHDKTQ